MPIVKEESYREITRDELYNLIDRLPEDVTHMYEERWEDGTFAAWRFDYRTKRFRVCITSLGIMVEECQPPFLSSNEAATELSIQLEALMK